MRIVHLLRKPISEGTVAANVLTHSCGGLNIDASRIAGIDPANAKRIGRDYTTGDTYFGDKVGQKTHAVVGGSLKGRWPGNLILQHLDGCRCEGEKEVRRDIRDATGAGAGVQVNDHKGGGQWKSSGRAVGSTTETVANWICVEGCPVAALDEQTGTLTSGKPAGTRHGTSKRAAAALTGFGDTGGASRFFRQIGGNHEGTP